MKQLYDYRMLVSIDGKPYRDTSFFKHIVYIEPEKAVTFESHEMPFEEIYEKVDSIMNAERGKTFLLKRKYVKFSFASFSFSSAYLYEKDKSTIRIKKEYIPFSCSMEHLSSLLDSEDFIEYLKDRGFNTYPLYRD